MKKDFGQKEEHFKSCISIKIFVYSLLQRKRAAQILLQKGFDPSTSGHAVQEPSTAQPIESKNHVYKERLWSENERGVNHLWCA